MTEPLKRKTLTARNREREPHLQGALDLTESKKSKQEFKSVRVRIEDYDFLDDIKRANKEFRNLSDVVNMIITAYKEKQ